MRVFSLGVTADLAPDDVRRVRVLNALCVVVAGSVIVFMLVDYLADRPMEAYRLTSHALALFGSLLVLGLHALGLYRAAAWAAMGMFVASASVTTVATGVPNPVRYYLIVVAATAAHLLRTRGEVILAFVLIGSVFVGLDTVGQPLTVSHLVRYVAIFAFLYVSVFLYESEVRRHLARIRRQHDEIRSAHDALEATVETVRGQHTTLRRQAERLRDLGAVKDRVVSVLSHDLRSPLASLSMTLDLLDDDDVSPDFRRECLRGVRQHLQATEEQLDDVLAWAATLLAPTDEAPGSGTFDLAAVVERAVSHARPRADDKGIALTLTAPQAASVVGDASHVLLVLRNLLSNAVKFTPTGGTVRVDVTDEGGDTVVRLRDNGPGMDPDTLRRVRGDGAAISTRGSDGETGTGLGLRLGQEFAQRGGATLHLDSQPGAGTTATLRLRRAPLPARTAAPPPVVASLA